MSPEAEHAAVGRIPGASLGLTVLLGFGAAGAQAPPGGEPELAVDVTAAPAEAVNAERVAGPPVVVVVTPPCPQAGPPAPAGEGREVAEDSGWLTVVAEVGVGVYARIAGVAQAGSELTGTVEPAGVPILVALGGEVATGKHVSLGAGFAQLHFDDPFARTGSRSVSSLEARVSVALPVAERWAVGLIGRAGVCRWTDEGEGGLLGWTSRLGVEGHWRFDPAMAVGLSVQHVSANAVNASGGAFDRLTEPQPVELAGWVMGLTVRID